MTSGIDDCGSEREGPALKKNGSSLDPSPRQRVWKQRQALAGVLAYERVGLLTAEQATHWRERLTNPDDEAIDAGTELGPAARSAAKRYVGELVDQLSPLRRDLDPETIRQHAECDAAIETLHALGVLDLYEQASWQEASWHKKAPWRSEPLVPPPGALAVAAQVPPESEQQQAEEDAAREVGWAARPKATTVVRLISGGPARQDDLAITALVVHADATSLHFHYLGERQGELDDRRRAFESFQRVNEGLTPPVLQDDEGTIYEPVLQRPASSSGAGGIPDPDRREAITGHWLYTPPAPPTAHTFVAHRDGARWTLTDER